MVPAMRQPIPVEPEELVSRVRGNVPEAMRTAPRWSLWRVDKEGHKVPYFGASCTDPETWVDFEEAAEALLGSNALGLNFATGEGWGALDLDDVLTAETMPPEADLALRHIQSYTEGSPSGTGLHVFFQYTGAPPPNRKTPAVEIYHGKHFLSVTGAPWGGRTRLRDCTVGARRIAEALTPKTPLPMWKPHRRLVVPEDDRALIEKMFDSKNGAKIQRLWSGETLHKSPSESDLSLMSYLVFWTDGDESRAVDLFLQSGRGKRAKAQRPDYLRRMVKKVVR